MVKSGVTIFRINLSWFEKAPLEKWSQKLREINSIAREEQIVLGIMLDTKGPEFRVRDLGDDAGPLDGDRRGYVYEPGKEITLTLDPARRTDKQTIAITAPPKTQFKTPGRRVVFGDGDYQAEINARSYDGKSMVLTCTKPLVVWELAKVNFPGTSITARALSEEDTEIIRFFLEEGKSLDPRVSFMFAQSFIKHFEDLDRFIHLLQHGMKEMNIDNPIVIAKLETYESSLPKNLNQIIERASAVMIARGDLANETSRQEVPQLQRDIIKVAKYFNKPVLLATQVYASMANPSRYNCTRPEAEDVRSALELGVDGFVLTGEITARPRDPEIVVAALASQILKDELDLIENDEREMALIKDVEREPPDNHYERLREIERKAFHKSMRKQMRDPDLPIEKQQWLGTTDFAIAAVFRANTYRAIGLFPFTQGGGTVREMSRFYPETDIYPVTGSAETAQSLLLCRCTHPVLVREADCPFEEFSIDRFKDLVKEIVNELGLRARRPNARYAICTMAHPPMKPGGVDTLLRIRIDEN
jgi:pyruvate kinase